MMHAKLCRTVGLVGCLMLASAGGLLGCKKKDAASADKGASAAASVSASATTAGSDDACSQLSAKLCTAAGDKSAACTSAKSTLELLSTTACAAGLKDFAGTEAKLKDRSKKCDVLVEKLCAGVGKDTETCKMVSEKTKQFPPDQCVQMLEHVDEIVADLQQQEKANQPLDAAQQAAIATTDAPAFGPADAKVTIVEFSDFECPYCSKAAEVTTKLKEKYGGKVRFVFRQFPLSFHKQADGAAQASLAAHSQGKFWEFHDHMFKNQQKLDRESLEGYAKAVGLNLEKFKADLDSKKHAEKVSADVKMGNEVAVQGTPTMFINGKRIANPTDFDALSKDIDALLGG